MITPREEASLVLKRVLENESKSYTHIPMGNIGSLRSAISNLAAQSGSKIRTALVSGGRLRCFITEDNVLGLGQKLEVNQLVLNKHDIEIMAALAILVRKGITKSIEITGITSKEIALLYPQVVKEFQMTDTEKGTLLL